MFTLQHIVLRSLEPPIIMHPCSASTAIELHVCVYGCFCTESYVQRFSRHAAACCCLAREAAIALLCKLAACDSAHLGPTALTAASDCAPSSGRGVPLANMTHIMTH